MNKINDALNFLCGKYGIESKGTLEQGADAMLLVLADGKKINLRPRRVERRFVELKKILDGNTLEGVSTLRFARFQSGGSLRNILEEELDLAEWIAGSGIIQMFASGDGTNVCNVIFRTADGKSGCLECGIKLPENTPGMDRHEIIARRGVASDRVVDTQIPQDSIYVWDGNGSRTFTDVDSELFGLPNEAVWNIRAAFAVLSDPKLGDAWNTAAEHARRLAGAALESAISGNPVQIKG